MCNQYMQLFGRWEYHSYACTMSCAFFFTLVPPIQLGIRVVNCSTIVSMIARLSFAKWTITNSLSVLPFSTIPFSRIQMYTTWTLITNTRISYQRLNPPPPWHLTTSCWVQIRTRRIRIEISPHVCSRIYKTNKNKKQSTYECARNV